MSTITGTTKGRSVQRQQFLLDVLTTACEGGIGYWALLENYDIWDDEDPDIQKFDPQLRLVDEEDACEEYPDIRGMDWNLLPPEMTHALNVDVVAIGIARFKEWCAGQRGEFGNPEGTSPVLNENHYWRQFLLAERTNGAEGDYDSEVADCIVQLGIFNSVVYG